MSPAPAICVAHPPTLLISSEDQVSTHWPLMTEESWCGEWQKGDDGFGSQRELDV